MTRPPILGVVAALLVGLLAGLLILRSGAPPDLTRADLEAARQLWTERGPASYALEIQMGGALTDERHIEVRDRRVVEMTINGRPASEGAWEYWSVEGLFDAIGTELSNAADPPPSLGISDPDQLVLRARFDPELGYPTEFFRHILGRQQGTEWRIVSFVPLD